MNDDNVDEFFYERWEQHLNELYGEFHALADDRAKEGMTVPAMIAALIQVARTVAKEQAVTVGPYFFERSVQDLLAGGDGMRVDGRSEDSDTEH